MSGSDICHKFDVFLPNLKEYRKSRTALHTDDKILTFWNALMIAAFCALYRCTENDAYLHKAEATWAFIEKRLCEGNTLFVGRREEARGGKGFLDDYAGCIFSLLALYDATFNCQYLRRAEQLMEKVEAEYFDPLNGGFFFYGREQETLIARPKESYDGAIPSGNSLMAYNLVRLGYLSPDEKRDKLLQSQLHFMGGEARQYPAGFALFLTALSDFFEPPLMITVVRGTDDLPELPFRIPLNAIVKVLDEPVDDYRLLNGESTFYVCKNHSCLAPMKQADFYNSLKSL